MSTARCGGPQILKLSKGKMHNSNDNGLPHSLEAEEGALGCVMLLASTAEEAAKVQSELDALLGQLTFAHFHDLRLKALWTELNLMRQENHVLDSITLFNWLQGRKQVEPCGGWPFL